MHEASKKKKKVGFIKLAGKIFLEDKIRQVQTRYIPQTGSH